MSANPAASSNGRPRSSCPGIIPQLPENSIFLRTWLHVFEKVSILFLLTLPPKREQREAEAAGHDCWAMRAMEGVSSLAALRGL